jgi:predicted MFS family arabinose efflux permease
MLAQCHWSLIMMETRTRLTSQWKDVVNLILGLWLIISPWVLNFASDSRPMWNAVIIGVIIAILAIAALISFRKWEEWIEAVLGLWLIISPYVLGFTTQMNATVDQVIVGIIVAALAIWTVAGSQAPHGAMR